MVDIQKSMCWQFIRANENIYWRSFKVCCFF